MTEEGERREVSDYERSHDIQRDWGEDRVKEDFGRNQPVGWNTRHLTLSNTALSFFNQHKILHSFKLLVDQIMATNYFDWNQAEYYKNMVDSLVNDLYIAGEGDDPEDSKIINIARSYMHQIIDGCRGGYRGTLATETRRTYRTVREGENQPQRRWGIFPR